MLNTSPWALGPKRSHNRVTKRKHSQHMITMLEQGKAGCNRRWDRTVGARVLGSTEGELRTMLIM